MSLEAWRDENPDDADYYSWSERAMEAGWINPADYSPGVIAILKERERQETEEGWTPDHDDLHPNGEMAGAAACYAMQATLDGIGQRQLAESVKRAIRELWPWAADWWKPKTTRQDLVRAGALIAAEIDRLDRASKRDSTS